MMTAYFHASPTLAAEQHGRGLRKGRSSFQCRSSKQLASKCEFSGVFHKYITMGLSAKVALRRGFLSRHPSSAPARVVHRPSYRRRLPAPRLRGGRALHLRCPEPPRPHRATARLWLPLSDQSQRYPQRTLKSSSKSAGRPPLFHTTNRAAVLWQLSPTSPRTKRNYPPHCQTGARV